MKIYDETNYKELCATHEETLADGVTVGVKYVSGQKRIMSRIPTVSGRRMLAAAPRFGDVFPVYPRGEWSARIKEQKAKRRRISDWQNFAPHDQDGLPTCWANGPSHAFTTMRVIQGLPLVYISACSLAVPISGGHVGGDEADAGNYLLKYGGASQDTWANNDTNRSLNTSAAVIESRTHHLALTMYSFNSFDEYITAALMDPPFTFAVAFNWWSHVISGGDALEIESNSFGMMYRNNWGSWGDNNDWSQPGYVTMREGHGTPDSGFAFGPVLPSLA